MAQTLFDEILTKGVRAGQIPARENKAREWYRDTASSYKRLNERQFLKDTERFTSRPRLGSMYMYYYDAKTKDQLPYFDRFPLVFPFKIVKGGFYGMNLHYIPLQYRAILMDNLYDIANNRRYDESTRLRLSYDVLTKSSKFKYFKPCVKRYLTSQMQTRFLYIYPSEWDIALFLPLERFQGARKTTVFADSRKFIRNA
jgi:hypothetical protein